MNTEYFKYLQTIVDCGSIRQAAEKLYLKQQNLGTIVKNIEDHYGIIIFERSRKGITLTEDGKYFMKLVQQVNNLFQQMETPLLYPSKKSYSYVVQDIHIYIQDIVSSESFVTIINEFHKSFPYVNITLEMKSQQEILQLIQEDPEAVGSIFTADEASFLDILQQKSLHMLPYFNTRLFAITNKNNPEAQHLKSISIYKFLQKNIILYTTQGLEKNFFYQLLHTYGKPNIVYTLNNNIFFLKSLQKGDYWSLGIPHPITKDKLVALPFQENVTIHSYLVYNQSAADSFVVQQFLQLADKMKYTLHEPYLIK